MILKKNKVLFFGRKNCVYTNKALLRLKSFGWKVKICLTDNRNTKLTKNLLNWEGDFIFSFRSYIIIPSNLLLKAKRAAAGALLETTKVTVMSDEAFTSSS